MHDSSFGPATIIDIAARAAGPAQADWWRGAVIYQVYPLSFFDSNGDGIGDLPGVLAKLDYIASLGVDAIWLSPFFTSPMKDFGYDVADYRAVDPVFGTLADFDLLLERAHALGLKVLIDQVWCHSSDQHPWFVASRAARVGAKADWYVWADAKPDGTPPNNWLSVFGGAAWSWEPRRRQYYLHHFLASQPQLNLRNPEVVEALLEIGAFWLDRGVDGFRFDAVDFMLHDPALRDNPAAPAPDGPPVKPFGLQHHIHDMLQPETGALLQRIRVLMDRYPGTVTLAEVSSQQGAFGRVLDYTAGGRLHMGYTLRLLREKLAPQALRATLGEIATGNPDGWVCWSFGNHDAERPVTRWKGGDAGSDAAFARMLMALLVSLRGTACLYQGDELGLPEAELDFADLRDPFGITYHPEFRGRDGSRTPMPWRVEAAHAGFSVGARAWLPVPAAHRGLAVDRQELDPSSPLNALRHLLRWRKHHPALLHGVLRLVDLPAPLFGFERRFGAERMLVVCNLAGEARSFALDDGVVPVSGHGFASGLHAGIVELPPYGMFFGAIDELAPGV
jgi:alpha-glucosidase